MGLGIVILADLCRRFSAGGVKVAQPGRPEPMGAPEIVHHPLTDQLGETIGIDWIEPRALADRHAFRLAVNRAA